MSHSTQIELIAKIQKIERQKKKLEETTVFPKKVKNDIEAIYVTLLSSYKNELSKYIPVNEPVELLPPLYL